MSATSEFFLSSKSSVVQIETLEIDHPNFTRTYWLVRNVAQGITLTLENSTDQAFEYYPCKITRLGLRNNLDQGFSITIGDVGTLLADELDAVEAANGFSTKPTVRYRTWRSDEPGAPLLGPVELEITKVSTTFGASTFDAVAPRLNVSGTGEVYSLARFPMLKGTL